MGSSFKDIVAWQKSHELIIKVYKTTRTLPDSERHGLSSQFQRAAVPIPTNIAEGCKRLGKSDKLCFMNIAQGSLKECRYYIQPSKDLEYINEHTRTTFDESLEEVNKLLNGYCKGIINNHHEYP